MNINMKKGNKEKENISIKNKALLLFPFLLYRYVYKILNVDMIFLVFTLATLIFT